MEKRQSLMGGQVGRRQVSAQVWLGVGKAEQPCALGRVWEHCWELRLLRGRLVPVKGPVTWARERGFILQDVRPLNCASLSGSDAALGCSLTVLHGVQALGGLGHLISSQKEQVTCLESCSCLAGSVASALEKRHRHCFPWPRARSFAVLPVRMALLVRKLFIDVWPPLSLS